MKPEELADLLASRKIKSIRIEYRPNGTKTVIAEAWPEDPIPGPMFESKLPAVPLAAWVDALKEPSVEERAQEIQRLLSRTHAAEILYQEERAKRKFEEKAMELWRARCHAHAAGRKRARRRIRKLAKQRDALKALLP